MNVFPGLILRGNVYENHDRHIFKVPFVPIGDVHLASRTVAVDNMLPFWERTSRMVRLLTRINWCFNRAIVKPIVSGVTVLMTDSRVAWRVNRDAHPWPSSSSSSPTTTPACERAHIHAQDTHTPWCGIARCGSWRGWTYQNCRSVSSVMYDERADVFYGGWQP